MAYRARTLKCNSVVDGPDLSSLIGTAGRVSKLFASSIEPKLEMGALRVRFRRYNMARIIMSTTTPAPTAPPIMALLFDPFKAWIQLLRLSNVQTQFCLPPPQSGMGVPPLERPAGRVTLHKGAGDEVDVCEIDACEIEVWEVDVAEDISYQECAFLCMNCSYIKLTIFSPSEPPPFHSQHPSP